MKCESLSRVLDLCYALGSDGMLVSMGGWLAFYFRDGIGRSDPETCVPELHFSS